MLSIYIKRFYFFWATEVCVCEREPESLTLPLQCEL